MKNLFLASFVILSMFVFCSCVVPVRPGPGAYSDEMVMAPEVVYEQPVFYPAPIVVGYPYDYFTYFMTPDGFVDLVFVDRYGVHHTEHWMYGGARMTHAQIHGWHQGYRIRNSEFRNHHQRFERHSSKQPGVHGTKPGPKGPGHNQNVQKPAQNKPAPKQAPPPKKQPKKQPEKEKDKDK